MTDNVNIRDATIDDLPAITSIDEQNSGRYKADYWQDLFDRFTQRPERGRYFLVAEGPAVDGKPSVVGFAVGEVRAWEFGSEPCGWVFAISVDTGWRESRIGSSLLEALASRFRSAGASTMRTMVARDDHLLTSFFRGAGMMAGPNVQLEVDLLADHVERTRA